jgi:hypothetical protein
MYLVLFLDQRNYEFVTSLHATRAEAEAAYEAMLRRFSVVKHPQDGPYDIKNGKLLPPRGKWDGLFDHYGEGVHLYRIKCDGGSAEEIKIDERHVR